jgi:PBP1b-binding outer membrane lipoprotein LpoB
MKKLFTILAIAFFMSACTAMAGEQKPAAAQPAVEKPAVSELAQSLAAKYKELATQQQTAAKDAMATKEYKAYTATKEFKSLQGISSKMQSIREAYNVEVGSK